MRGCRKEEEEEKAEVVAEAGSVSTVWEETLLLPWVPVDL